VMLSILLLANWKDRQVFVGGNWETVRRGELMQSLLTISKHAKVSVKVVRTTVAKMFADDRAAGGRGPFLTERWIGLGREVGTGSGIAPGTPPGTAAGTPIRVLTIVNYDEYQSITDDTGTGTGTGSGMATGTPGAREGHARGTSRTKGTKETKKTCEADASPAPEVLSLVPDEPDRLQPLKADLEAAFFAARGSKYLHGGAKDTQALKRLLSTAEPSEILRRWKAALAESGFHSCVSFAQLAMPEHWNHFARGVAPVASLRKL
jgi:hypothetical protein